MPASNQSKEYMPSIFVDFYSLKTTQTHNHRILLNPVRLCNKIRNRCFFLLFLYSKLKVCNLMDYWVLWGLSLNSFCSHDFKYLAAIDGMTYEGIPISNNYTTNMRLPRSINWSYSIICAPKMMKPTCSVKPLTTSLSLNMSEGLTLSYTLTLLFHKAWTKSSLEMISNISLQKFILSIFQSSM